MTRRLGRIPSPPDGRDYHLERFLEDADVPTCWMQIMAMLGLRSKVWPNPQPVLDQGDYGTCVGNGCAQWGNTLPVCDQFTEADARRIYYEATALDGAPDDPDAPGGGQQGATVRSGLKALRRRGRIAHYARALSASTVRAWLYGRGPIIVGTNWYAGMCEPDARGFVHPTGDCEGGHCYLLTGMEDWWTVKALNSWGLAWGEGGSCRLHMSDLTRLLAEDGEAWTAVELPLEG